MKSKSIHFTKMHGLGNDFVVINTLDQPLDIKKLSITQLSNRHIGIGFDQLLLIEPSEHADVFCRIFNADGTEAEQCGNGLRCIARYVHEKGIFAQPSLKIETKAGVFPVAIKDYDHIRVTFAAPQIQEKLTQLNLTNYPEALPLSILSLGNPHAIVKVDSLEATPVEKLGKAISTHILFPNSANVGFMQIMDEQHIRLRTFERGAGETHACGSNACAAACIGIVNGWLKHKVTVEFRYGSLAIEWSPTDKFLSMTGPAANVFVGVV